MFPTNLHSALRVWLRAVRVCMHVPFVSSQEPLKPRTNVNCRFLENELAIKIWLSDTAIVYFRKKKLIHKPQVKLKIFILLWSQN
jgi:hypothetical protein